MTLEEGEIVFCTVNKIVGTTVFVSIDGNGEGSIPFSEVAAGRIRNIRDYIVPKKRIICKILRISNNNHIDLSLRRVTLKEKKELKEKYKQEKSYKSILKTVLGDDAEKIIKEITKENNLYEFLENSKEISKNLEKIAGKSNAKKILEILNSQKKKKAILKKQIYVTSKKPNGVTLIKNLLMMIKNVKIKYLSAGNYTIETEAENLKSADANLKKTLLEMGKKAKKQGIELSISEK